MLRGRYPLNPDNLTSCVLRAHHTARPRVSRGRLRGLRDRWRADKLSVGDVQARVNAWVAHAEHADTWQLRQAIFAGGWFDPKRKIGLKK